MSTRKNRTQQGGMPKTAIDYMLVEWQEEDKKSMSGQDQSYDIQNIVTPFYPEGHQRKFLAKLFGKEQIDVMSATVIMSSLGLLDDKCPGYRAGESPVRRKDPYTGRFYCSREEEVRTATDETGTCKSGETEVIDMFGERTCVPLITRGEFQCPPPDRPLDTKLITMSDGTGLCVPANSDFDTGDLVGLSLANDKFDINDLNKFIKLYKQMEIKRFNNVNLLNGVFRMYEPGVLKERLSEGTYMKLLGDAIDATPTSVETANIALYLHAKSLNIVPNTFNYWNNFFKFDGKGPVQLMSMKHKQQEGMGQSGGGLSSTMTGNGELMKTVGRVLRY